MGAGAFARSGGRWDWLCSWPVVAVLGGSGEKPWGGAGPGEWIDLETGGRGVQTRSPLQGCGWCLGGTSLSRSTWSGSSCTANLHSVADWGQEGHQPMEGAFAGRNGGLGELWHDSPCEGGSAGGRAGLWQDGSGPGEDCPDDQVALRKKEGENRHLREHGAPSWACEAFPTPWWWRSWLSSTPWSGIAGGAEPWRWKRPKWGWSWKTRRWWTGCSNRSICRWGWLYGFEVRPEEGGRGFLVLGINGCERGILIGSQITDPTAALGGGASEIIDLNWLNPCGGTLDLWWCQVWFRHLPSWLGIL